VNRSLIDIAVGIGIEKDPCGAEPTCCAIFRRKNMVDGAACVVAELVELAHAFETQLGPPRGRVLGQVRSITVAPGAFSFTDSMPPSLAVVEEYISLVPITCPFVAVSVK
jgi:hypothetical protein